MEQALRPHRGGTVLALGILSLVAGLFLIPLGVVAWIMGSRDLKGMKRGEVDPAGRSLTQIGWVFGIAACVLWLGSAASAALLFGVVPVREGVTMYSSSPDRPGTRRVESHFDNGSHSFDDSNSEETWEELQRPDGEWVKEGIYVRRSPSGAKLEEGYFRTGKREGQWTFWNEDGSVDLGRSGIYEDDVRIQAGATPPGDFDTGER